MSKLTKQEVNAIASKLRRSLEEKAHLEKLRVIHEYIPSQEYLEVQANFKRIQEISKKAEALRVEREAIGKNISKIFDRLEIPGNYWNWWDWWECPDETYIEEKLEEIVKTEVKVPSVPSIEELKEDITIAAIDSDFDVEDFIKSRLENDYRGS